MSTQTHIQHTEPTSPHRSHHTQDKALSPAHSNASSSHSHQQPKEGAQLQPVATSLEAQPSDSEAIDLKEELELKKIKSVDELKIDFKENEKMLSSLSSNIDDLFKKISSLTEQVENEVASSPASRSLKEINVSPPKGSASPYVGSARWKSQTLIADIQKEKEAFLKSIEEVSVPCPIPQPPGINMSMFEVGRALDHGKFGEVLLCRHRTTATVYALKKIFKSTVQQYKMQDQILVEVEACSRMNHPNIMKTYAAFTDEFHIFLLTEFAEGDKLLKKFNSSEGYVSRIISQTLDAVRSMHQNNVAHRDLKPENILINQHGDIKICDFGWSSLLDQQSSMDIICGTLDYVCPQMVSKSPYSKQVDLWSVGVLTYELIFGLAPFKDESREATFSRVQQIKYEFPQGYEVSQECLDFIRRLLQPEQKRMRLEQCLEHPFISKYPKWGSSSVSEFDDLFK